MLFEIVTHSTSGMCYNSVTVLGFGQLYHQLGRGELGQQPVKLIEQPGCINGLSRFCRPQGAAGYPHLIAVGQQLKGRGVVDMPGLQKFRGHGPGQTAVTVMPLAFSSSAAPMV